MLCKNYCHLQKSCKNAFTEAALFEPCRKFYNWPMLSNVSTHSSTSHELKEINALHNAIKLFYVLCIYKRHISFLSTMNTFWTFSLVSCSTFTFASHATSSICIFAQFIVVPYYSSVFPRHSKTKTSFFRYLTNRSEEKQNIVQCVKTKPNRSATNIWKFGWKIWILNWKVNICIIN